MADSTRSSVFARIHAARELWSAAIAAWLSRTKCFAAEIAFKAGVGSTGRFGEFDHDGLRRVRRSVILLDSSLTAENAARGWGELAVLVRPMR